MLDRTMVGAERGDCTAPYLVTLDKEYTVEELVQQILTQYNDEWGYIGIDTPGTWFGDPNCQYDYGHLRTYLPKDVLSKKVQSVRADGGWTRMDWYIKVEARK